MDLVQSFIAIAQSAAQQQAQQQNTISGTEDSTKLRPLVVVQQPVESPDTEVSEYSQPQDFHQIAVG